MRRTRTAVIYGTRPEAIKVAPVVTRLQQLGRDPLVICTGQHGNLLDGIKETLGLEPHINLGIYEPGANLDHILAAALTRIGEVLSDHPEVGALLVHGDTTTTLAGALAGFHHHIPVVHLEAGLRTGDLDSPFPEEGNRQLAARVAAASLAATDTGRHNLLAEGVSPATIAVIGNTVIDALLATVQRPVTSRLDPHVADILNSGSRTILLTVHRRESWGEPLQDVARGITAIALDHPDVHILAPLHPNPVVRDAVTPYWRHLPNVTVLDPQPYDVFAHLLAHATLALSDSGGIQEEAPAVNTPLGVLRNTTERQEVINSGQAVLLGTDATRIEGFADAALRDAALYAAMTGQTSPFGDGHEAERAVAVLEAVINHTALPDVNFTWNGQQRGGQVGSLLAADGIRVLNPYSHAPSKTTITPHSR